MQIAVQLISCVWLFATPWAAAHQASLSFTVSQSLLKIMSIESVMPSDHLIFCCPLLLLPSIFPSTGVFSNESVLPFRWPKYWSFSFSISPSKEIATISSKKKRIQRCRRQGMQEEAQGFHAVSQHLHMVALWTRYFGDFYGGIITSAWSIINSIYRRMGGGGREWGCKFQTPEKEMATHSSVLAWRIPGTGEPGGLLSMGSHRVGHDWSDLAAAIMAWPLWWQAPIQETLLSPNKFQRI